MALTEPMVEVLEALWTLGEKGEVTCDEVIRQAVPGVSRDLIRELERDGLVIVHGADLVALAPEGRRLAEQIIRRHRLAERLICDVLGAQVDDSEAAACEFEHLLADGIVNSICTLLGHPRFCPHNRPIPMGDCCRQDREEVKPIVIPCNQLGVGESAQLAYFCATEHARMLKLASLGFAPGCRIKLLQKWPSFVLQVDETEIAVEEEVARNIYVRR